MTENPFPSHENPEPIPQGSLERGVRGDYDFSISAVLSEAWGSVRGTKWTFQLALAFYLLVYIVVALLTVKLLPGANIDEQVQDGLTLSIFLQGIIPALVNLAVVTPLTTGLFMLGVRRAVGAPIKASMVFGYYSKALPLIIAMIVMYILITIGFFLLILPGVYLCIAYQMAAILVAEKNLRPWQALEASRKAIGKRWFKVFFFTLVLGLINIIAVLLTLGIGLIWTLPLSYISLGILYRIIFGCESQTPTSEDGQSLTVAQSF